MEEWAKVVAYPLGFSAFALYLVYLASNKEQNSWARRLFFALAGIAFLVGIGLAINQNMNPGELTKKTVTMPEKSQNKQVPISTIHQETHGRNGFRMFILISVYPK